jgi:hypothetical protein
MLRDKREAGVKNRTVIDFEIWLDQVIGYCEFICHKQALRRAWIEGDRTITSIYAYDELYEQLIGDMDLDSLVEQFAPKIANEEAIQTLRAFSKAIHRLDTQIDSHSKLQSSRHLLDSNAWAAFSTSASQVMATPYIQAFRECRKTPDIVERLKQIDSEYQEGS